MWDSLAVVWFAWCLQNLITNYKYNYSNKICKLTPTATLSPQNKIESVGKILETWSPQIYFFLILSFPQNKTMCLFGYWLSFCFWTFWHLFLNLGGAFSTSIHLLFPRGFIIINAGANAGVWFLHQEERRVARGHRFHAFHPHQPQLNPVRGVFAWWPSYCLQHCDKQLSVQN